MGERIESDKRPRINHSLSCHCKKKKKEKITNACCFIDCIFYIIVRIGELEGKSPIRYTSPYIRRLKRNVEENNSKYDRFESIFKVFSKFPFRNHSNRDNDTNERNYPAQLFSDRQQPPRRLTSHFLPPKVRIDDWENGFPFARRIAGKISLFVFLLENVCPVYSFVLR